MFETGSDITHETAKAVLKTGLQRIAQGDTQLDCTALTHFDSSALAVFLAWRRAASAKGAELQIRQAPPALVSLARAYGIDALTFGVTPS